MQNAGTSRDKNSNHPIGKTQIPYRIHVQDIMGRISCTLYPVGDVPTGYSAVQDIFLDMFPTGYNLQDMLMTYRMSILPTGYHLQDIMCCPQDKNDVHVMDTPNG